MKKKKLKKIEALWLISVIVCYLAYNLPFVPSYNNPKGAIIHGIVTLVPLWISVYLGFFQICKRMKIKDKEEPSC